MSKRFEGHLKGADQNELFYQTWKPDNVRGVFVITHGLAEHSECYHPLAKKLSEDGWQVFAWDLRGHGRTAEIGAFICAFALWAPLVFASDNGGAGGGEDVTGSKALYELGFQVGDLLPNQIDGATEILGLGGVRAGFRIAPQTYCEGGLIMGNGGGVEWKNAHIDARMDIPVEGLVGLAYVGADSIYYKGVGTGQRILFGGHVGGGIQALMTGALWFRGDMKFNFNPGTSLYIGAGFEFRFGG